MNLASLLVHARRVCCEPSLVAGAEGQIGADRNNQPLAAQAADGFSLGSPQLRFQGRVFRDPRDAAIRQVRLAHWGNDAEDWGGFIAGDAEPPDESPFHRRQSVFCFLLRSDE